MTKMLMPRYVEKLIELFAANGFQAYVVGGAVRDYLLGLQPKDYDFATDATPEEVCQIAVANGLQVVENLGHNFGVVMLVVDGKAVEVGTFRQEVYGEDAHRPEQVSFCHKLEADLARRDFTINAMAAGRSGEIIDLYQGWTDLQNKLLRTVGAAEKRFSEDALRMFRACRFCAQLGFQPDHELLAAMTSEAARAEGLSLERVKAELESTLVARHADTGLRLLAESGLLAQNVKCRKNGFDLSTPLLPELQLLSSVGGDKQSGPYKAWQNMLAALVLAKPELEVRWSILIYNISCEQYRLKSSNCETAFAGIDGYAADLAEKILLRYKYKEKFIKKIQWLLANRACFTNLLSSEDNTARDWLKEQARQKYFHNAQQLSDAVVQLCDFVFAGLAAAGSKEQRLTERSFNIVEMAGQMPVHTSDLLLKGQDVMQFLPPQDVGRFLQDALSKVQEGSVANNKTDLSAWLESYISK